MGHFACPKAAKEQVRARVPVSPLRGGRPWDSPRPTRGPGHVEKLMRDSPGRARHNQAHVRLNGSRISPARRGRPRTPPFRPSPGQIGLPAAESVCYVKSLWCQGALALVRTSKQPAASCRPPFVHLGPRRPSSPAMGWGGCSELGAPRHGRRPHTSDRGSAGRPRRRGGGSLLARHLAIGGISHRSARRLGVQGRHPGQAAAVHASAC